MGCFNAACSISHLDIEIGNKCYFLVLKPNQFKDKKECSVLCYPDDRYKLFCLPIVGEYDDYGRIEDIEKTEHTKYLESVLGMPIESLIEIACEGRDVYDSYSEKFNLFIEHKDILDYSSKLIDLMKALFQEEVEGSVYSYQNKKDCYKFLINDDGCAILENDIKISSRKYSTTVDFLRDFHDLTGIYLNIINEETFQLVHDVSGCFVLKEIADALINNKEFWMDYFSGIENWSFTPAVAHHLGFKEIEMDKYSIEKDGKEYFIQFQSHVAIVNGEEIRYIEDFQKVTEAFDSEIKELAENYNRVDMDGYNFRIGIKAKYDFENRYLRNNLDYLYEQSYIFRLNIPMMHVYKKVVNDWKFEEEYLIADKLYHIFDKTHNMMAPTCNASQTDKRDYQLMLYKVAEEWTEQKKKEYEEEWG